MKQTSQSGGTVADTVAKPTITIRAVCACGHPAAHHDAGTCWTDDAGAEVWDHTACQCPGFVPRGLLDAVEGVTL